MYGWSVGVVSNLLQFVRVVEYVVVWLISEGLFLYVVLVAKLDAQLKQTEKALDICFNRLPIMDRMAAQAEFKEWLGANDAHYLIGSQNVVKITG